AAGELVQDGDRRLVAGLAHVGEREPGGERDADVLVVRELREPAASGGVAEAGEPGSVPDLELDRRGGLEPGEQRARRIGAAELADRLGGVAADLFVLAVVLGVRDERGQRGLIFDLADRLGALDADRRLGLLERIVERGLRVAARGVAVDLRRLGDRRWRLDLGR